MKNKQLTPFQLGNRTLRLMGTTKDANKPANLKRYEDSKEQAMIFEDSKKQPEMSSEAKKLGEQKRFIKLDPTERDRTVHELFGVVGQARSAL